MADLESSVNRLPTPGMRRALLIAGGAVLFALVFLANLNIAKLVGPLNPDQAAIALYAQEVLDGNVFLRGWELTTVTFYTEIPLYMAAIQLFGLSLDVMRVVPAFLHTVNIFLLAGLVWKFRIRNVAWILLPVLVMALLPAGGLWSQALFGPMHHATTACGFLALLLLGLDLTLPKLGRTSAALFGIALVGTWGDLAYLFVFAFPLLVACLYAHRDQPERQLESVKTVALPTLIGSILGHLMVVLMRAAGMGTPGGLEENSFVAARNVAPKILATSQGWLDLFFPSVWGRPANIYTLGAIMLALCFWWWVRAMAWATANRRAAAIDVLCAVMPISVFVMVIATMRQGWENEIRMLVPSYMLGVLLVSRWWQSQESPRRNAWAMVLMLIGALVTAYMFVKVNAATLLGSDYGQRFKQVAAFLDQKGLRHGHADFWSGHLLRVASGNRLEFSSLMDGSGVHLAPYYWSADAEWFVGWSSNFMVIRGQGEIPDKGAHCRADIEKAAIAYWGKPLERYEVEGMVVLVWDEAKSIGENEMPPKLKRKGPRPG